MLRDAPRQVPHWQLLYAFPGAAIVTLVLLLGVALWAWRNSKFEVPLWTPLPQVKKWSFGDSFASKISLSASLIVAVVGNKQVFGSFGPGAAGVAPLCTVAAALSAAFVAVAPLALAIFAQGARNRLPGILLAALLTITGTGGQLAVLTIAATELDLGGTGALFAVTGILSAVLLLGYAAKALLLLLEDSANAETSAHTRATIL